MVCPRIAGGGFWVPSAIAAVAVAIGALGCASPNAPTGADDGVVQSLGEVSVARDGEGSIVFLDGLDEPTYALNEQGDDHLVVVDLVGVDQGEAEQVAEAMTSATRQVSAYDGVVDMVTLSTFEGDEGVPTTRVEIQLAAAGIATVENGDGGLEVHVRPPSDQAKIEAAMGVSESTLADASAAAEIPDAELAAPESAESAADAQAAGDEIASSQTDETTGSSDVAVLPTAPPAKMLVGLSASAVEGGALVGLLADGSLENVEVFTLSNPSRLVIDLPGLAAAKSVKNASIDSPFVKAVRLGAHAGKLRIVVDGGAQAGDFAGRQVTPGATGLWIAIGEGDALAQALEHSLSEMESSFVASATSATPPAAPEASADALADAMTALSDADSEASAATSEPEAASAVVSPSTEASQTETAAAASDLEVYGLSFERLEKLDRTAILMSGAVHYTTAMPDPATFVVRIPKAHISNEASDRLFPEHGGPVSMIHAFQQPDVNVPEVRVVFTRAPNQNPVLSVHESSLFVDFEDMGVAAAAPPAFPEAGSATAPAAADLAAAEAAEATANDAAAEASDSEQEMAASMPSKAALEAAPVANPAVMAQAEALGADADEAMSAMPEPSAAPAAVEVPAAIEVLEEGGLIDGKEYRGRRVSLDFKDVAIADVLRLIAEVSDLNIIAGDEVTGNVTIRLVEVPWDQALDVILMTKGLGFVRVGNVLRIAPADVLKAEEEVRLQERRNKEKLEDLEVKLLPVNYAMVKDLEALVRRLLSARGTINLDARTNTLIIKDISSVIDEATALVAAIDTQTPQVMIEAKIVEANLDFSRELGTVWGLQTNQFNDAFATSPTKNTGLGSEDLRFIGGNSLAFANPIKSVPTALANFGALILNEDFRVDAQIQAAEAAGDGKVISSPRVVTLDNKKATIKQGVSIPFQTFEGGDAKLEFIDAVLSLIVTPHVTADRSVIMDIQVTKNAPDSSVPTTTGSPAISKNVAQTMTLVKDGQTLVLGGIYTITKTHRQSRVPYLHRIPVIGSLFKSNSILDSRKELLVFVTPRIVRVSEMALN